MVEQVKVFTANVLAEGLETELNIWIREEEPKITRVSQSSACHSGGTSTILTVFYTPKPN